MDVCKYVCKYVCMYVCMDVCRSKQSLVAWHWSWCEFVVRHSPHFGLVSIKIQNPISRNKVAESYYIIRYDGT